MPTYSYACTVCEHKFDAQQAFSDSALTTCPECDGQLRKLFGSVGVVFKGPGFYRTDARASNARNGKPSKRSESVSSSIPATPGNGSSAGGSSTGGSSTGGSSAGESSTGGSKTTTPSGSSTSASSPAAASA